MLEELQRIAEGLSGRLRRSIAIDDPQIHLLVHTAHRDEVVDQHRIDSILQLQGGADIVTWVLSHGISAAVHPVRIPPNPRLGAIARVCVPIRYEGMLLGYLWLLDAEESLDADDLAACIEAADQAASLLFSRRWMDDARRGLDRELLQDLLGTDAERRQTASRKLCDMERVPAKGTARAIGFTLSHSVEPDGVIAVDLAMERLARRLAPGRSIWSYEPNAGGVVVTVSTTPLDQAKLRAAIQHFHHHVGAVPSVANSEVHVGVGPEVDCLARSHRSHEHALEAITVAQRVSRYSPIAWWDELGVYRMLAQLPLDSLHDNAVPAGLLNLVQQDADGILFETLECYLDEAGNAPSAVARLNIHRTTLYYRLKRIEDLTEMSLTNGSDRLALHLGTKLVPLLRNGNGD